MSVYHNFTLRANVIWGCQFRVCGGGAYVFIWFKFFLIKSLDIGGGFLYKYSRSIASSSNGRTADSDSVNRGSNPCEAAKHKKAT